MPSPGVEADSKSDDSKSEPNFTGFAQVTDVLVLSSMLEEHHLFTPLDE